MQTSKSQIQGFYQNTSQDFATPVDNAVKPSRSATHIYPCRLAIPELLVEQSVMQLKQGAVLEKVYLSDQSGPIVRIVKPGEVLSSSRLLYRPSGSCVISVRAVHLHGTVIQSWPSEELLSVENNFAAPQLCGLYGRSLAACWQQMSELVYHSAHYRLANLLIDLATTFGVPCEAGRAIVPLRLNIKELADCIGSQRETASIGLNRFKRHGLVTFESGLWSVFAAELASYREKL